MRILFDLGHPANVHYFKYLIRYLENNGHSCVVLARDKDVTASLLHELEIPFINKGAGGTHLLDRIEYTSHSLALIQRTIQDVNPHLCISHGSPYLAFASWRHNLPHIMFNDTEKAIFFKQVTKWFRPDTYVPECFYETGIEGLNKLPSYMELAYLHEDLFTPKPFVLKELGDEYILLRFVSQHALHDIGLSQTSYHFKKSIVERLQPYGNVWISSEIPLPDDLRKFRLPVPPGEVHSVIAGARLVIGNSATMCAEAAVLGTPSIHIHQNQWGYIRELEERYGLLRHFDGTEHGYDLAVKAAVDMLEDVHLLNSLHNRRKRMLSEKENMFTLMARITEEKIASLEQDEDGGGG